MQYGKLKILADENMPRVEEIFSKFGQVTLCPGREMSASDLADVDVLLVRSITQVNEALLMNTPVRFVGTATIGTDHIDLGYLRNNQIGFSSAPGCNADAVVEYVLSSIFLLAQQQGFNPKERTYGIVGVGNVGRRLQQRLIQLGFKVLLNDPPRAEKESGFVDLNTLIAQADVLCLHTPLTEDGAHPTRYLFDAERLQRLREGCILLNAGRGPVIDNAALLSLLRKRNDLSVVLDVWENEPAVSPELADLCQIVSPHIAGYSLDGKIRGTFMLYEALCQFLSIEKESQLEDFLPLADVSEVTQGELSALQLMQMIYDPRVDDQLLRDTLKLPEAEQRKAFDQLRKQYRIRREFASLSVMGSPEPHLIEGLGFRLAEVG